MDFKIFTFETPSSIQATGEIIPKNNPTETIKKKDEDIHYILLIGK